LANPHRFAGDGFGPRVGVWLTGFRTVCGRTFADDSVRTRRDMAAPQDDGRLTAYL
jgi:hypothetical protein